MGVALAVDNFRGHVLHCPAEGVGFLLVVNGLLAQAKVCSESTGHIFRISAFLAATFYTFSSPVQRLDSITSMTLRRKLKPREDR